MGCAWPSASTVTKSQVIEGDRGREVRGVAVNIGAQAAGRPNSARIPSPAVSMMRPPWSANDSLVRLEITDGARLVSAHERAVTGDVGCEDRCKTALLTFSHSRKLGLDASAADKLHAQPLRCA